ncbi:hypothetical protein [Shewanella holmiensis]|uniref:Uncharacterized protein n=1 Tax=Shewanella holmiensis TaxID=2952222 RepID=A0A9X2WLA0_9GAMM|nr:hypothetical protein [Shewanella holmiensis]MCT7941007.1 hypothetical protein [Shewanella holmiensis]
MRTNKMLECKREMVLDFKIKHREGSEDNGTVVHESYSSDFTIDGKSLLAELVSKAGGHGDFLGCFARGWDNLNKHSLKQLLLQEPPETESGRSLIYVCPECADIGCGAYGCKITKVGEEYIWSEFAYENGYEDPDPIKEIGPFKFSVTEYENVVNCAFAL